MSSKLVKLDGKHIEIPNDEVIVNLIVTRSGKTQLQAPSVSPRDLCKILSNLSTDIMFAALQQEENKTLSQV